MERGPASQQHHRPEGVEHQDGLATVDDGQRGAPAAARRAALQEDAGDVVVLDCKSILRHWLCVMF